MVGEGKRAWRSAGIQCANGLATGDLVVGAIRAPNARAFTEIGDTVNLASRLEEANNV